MPDAASPVSPSPSPTPSTGAGEGRGPGDEPVYCRHCGESQEGVDHLPCARRLELEPPRYCAVCRRRMVVQVTPRGWSASCSRHGESGGHHGALRQLADDEVPPRR